MSFTPPPPPSWPPYQATTLPAPGKGLATAALVLGLCSLIPFVGVFCAVLAIIFGITILARSAPGRKMAITGLAFAGLGVLESSGLTFLVLREYDYDVELARDRILNRGTFGPHPSYIRCHNQLIDLGAGVHAYTETYNVPPPSLTVVMGLGVMRPEVLECPGVPITGKPSIFVLFPKSGDVPPTTLIACDYRGNHADGRNVLYHNGMVTFVKTEAAFQAELAKPENAAFAAALRAKEGP